jgi:N-hydroxyarylamine O-acetyltransferase
LIDVGAYLRRINVAGPLSVDVETLRRLHLAHLRAVPFENLSIHWHEPIILADETLFDKVVRRRRGGFCYELNGLFAALLRALGFRVTMLSAGVANANGGFGPDFDHMTLMVNLERPYLADVGFGDSFLEPLRLDDRDEQSQGARTFRIDELQGQWVLNRREPGEDFRPQYRFDLRPHVYADYGEMCLYHQRSPDSHFTRERICSIATPDGRLTLSGRRFITTTGADRVERVLDGDREVSNVLQQTFGITRAGPEGR